MPAPCSASVRSSAVPLPSLRERGELWPDVVDDLAFGVRAGLSLPEALTRVGERGPVPLRPDFIVFGARYQRTGRFGDALDELKVALADPTCHGGRRTSTPPDRYVRA